MSLFQPMSPFWGSESLARRYGLRLLSFLASWGLVAGIGAGVLAGLIQAGIVMPVVDFETGLVAEGPMGVVEPRQANDVLTGMAEDAKPAIKGWQRTPRDIFSPAVAAGSDLREASGQRAASPQAPPKSPVVKPQRQPAGLRQTDIAGARQATQAASPARTIQVPGTSTLPPQATQAPVTSGTASATEPAGKSTLAPEPEATPEPPKGLTLKGIAVMGAQRAAILAVGTASDAYVAGEEVVDGWKVESITTTAVTITKDGHNVVLEWKGD